MRDRQYRESFLPTPLVIVFATCVPLFLFKSDPDLFRCVCIVTVDTSHEELLFSVCIAAHYGTQPNVSIAKLRIRRLGVRIPPGTGGLTAINDHY
jgi:hypothetical protein